MVESRCGCLCSACEYKEKENCPGCLIMEKPFWSDSCDLKNCCEAKKFEYCGLCPDFPCKDMINMAGDDVNYSYSRIENCKMWASAK